MTLSLPDAIAYARIPLVVALALFAGYHRPQGCFWALLLTVALELAQRILSKQKGPSFQASPLAAKIEPYAEGVLYVTIPVVFVLLFPAFLKAHMLVIAGLIAAYLITELFGYFKFHKLTSYQTHGSKMAGILLGITALTLFWTQKIDWLLYTSAVVVVASFAEEVAISVVLPEWRSGVTSLWHAQRIARRLRAAAVKAGKAQAPAPAPTPRAEAEAAAAAEPEGPAKAQARPAAGKGGGNGHQKKGNRSHKGKHR